MNRKHKILTAIIMFSNIYAGAFLADNGMVERDVRIASMLLTISILACVLKIMDWR